MRPIVVMYEELAIPKGLTKDQQIKHTKNVVDYLAGCEVNLARDSDDPVVARVSIIKSLFLTFFNTDW